MIPRSTLTEDIIVIEDIGATLTYKLSSDKIQGFTDNLEALKQAIYKVLDTEQYEYPIYGFSYGLNLESLIGKNPSYVQIELKRRIKECLLRDDRIQNIDNFRFITTGDEMLCEFDVQSIYGAMTIQKEVNI